MNAPTKRNKKLYATREAILKDIESARKKMERIRAKSVEHDEEAKAWYALGHQVNGDNEKDEAARLWRKASRIENTRLKRLGSTLAIFDTIPLSGECEAVVLQNL